MNDFEKLKGKKVALIGGAGFIGHNLALKLVSHGAIVSVVDGLQVNSFGALRSNLSPNPSTKMYLSFLDERMELLQNSEVNFDLIDAREYQKVTQVIEKINPDVVVHLAAVAHANRSNKDPFSTFDHSMRTLENVLDAIRDKDIQLIFFSSSMVYGNFGDKEAVEENICEPLGIYGALKYGAEKLLIGYSQVFGTRYTILRPSALYGERCVSRRVGQAFIENALTGNDLTINGDGEDALDFTYIEDLVQGVMPSICKKNATNQIFNITYGQGRKINDLAKIVIKNFPKSSIKYNKRDALMPERGTLSIEKAKTMLGYNPKFPIEIGMEHYIKWYMKREKV